MEAVVVPSFGGGGGGIITPGLPFTFSVLDDVGKSVFVWRGVFLNKQA